MHTRGVMLGSNRFKTCRAVALSSSGKLIVDFGHPKCYSEALRNAPPSVSGYATSHDVRAGLTLRGCQRAAVNQNYGAPQGSAAPDVPPASKQLKKNENRR